MSTRNVIQATFDEFGKTRGGAKKSGSWYLPGSDTLAVLNLQKSQYGALLVQRCPVVSGDRDPTNPKPSHCHVQTRLESLIPEDVRTRVKSFSTWAPSSPTISGTTNSCQCLRLSSDPYSTLVRRSLVSLPHPGSTCSRSP